MTNKNYEFKSEGYFLKLTEERGVAVLEIGEENNPKRNLQFFANSGNHEPPIDYLIRVFIRRVLDDSDALDLAVQEISNISQSISKVKVSEYTKFINIP